jgi:hydroxymethylpyrimidine/phosphomethylpyrimidine kinase
MAKPVPTALTIATTDSGGGAGIAADLKAFAACGVHGTLAVVALTAQNTTGVSRIETVSPEMIVEQVRMVADDFDVGAVKVGMLADAPTVEAAVAALALVEDAPIVIDPVMVAESGALLLDADGREALVRKALPLATVATPNLAEARELSGLGNDASQEELARGVLELGPRYVVVTGGHTEDGIDLFHDGDEAVAISGPRHPDGASHGSGCTHSSALAAGLALGDSPLEAAQRAREVAATAVGAGLRGIGAGAGPVDALGIAARSRGSRSGRAGKRSGIIQA